MRDETARAPDTITEIPAIVVPHCPIACFKFSASVAIDPPDPMGSACSNLQKRNDIKNAQNEILFLILMFRIPVFHPFGQEICQS